MVIFSAMSKVILFENMLFKRCLPKSEVFMKEYENHNNIRNYDLLGFLSGFMIESRENRPNSRYFSA